VAQLPRGVAPEGNAKEHACRIHDKLLYGKYEEFPERGPQVNANKDANERKLGEFNAEAPRGRRRREKKKQLMDPILKNIFAVLCSGCHRNN
jgi:hypothetical protein